MLSSIAMHEMTKICYSLFQIEMISLLSDLIGEHW